MLVRTLALLTALTVSPLGGCKGNKDSDDSATADELPPLKLTDATSDLLLTWIDERGGTHTETAVERIPGGSRTLVRVITKEAGHGTLFYVADLDQKGTDGSYAVRTMKRAEWEQIIAERRAAYRARHAPKPPKVATASPKPDASQAPPPADLAGVEVVIYGASWCKPCHDAAAYLRRKGVRVTEYDIEKQPRRAREMQNKLRDAGMTGGSIPVIDVGGIVMRGFSPGRLDRALAKAGKTGTSM